MATKALQQTGWENRSVTWRIPSSRRWRVRAGTGPWSNEPDRIEWREAPDLYCLMSRNAHMGSWCGFVGVTEAHPWWERRLHHGLLALQFADPEPNAVHGGLSFAGRRGENLDEYWFFGFDCAHYEDTFPTAPRAHMSSGAYRDVAFVRAEVDKLVEAAQAASTWPSWDRLRVWLDALDEGRDPGADPEQIERTLRYLRWALERTKRRSSASSTCSPEDDNDN